jgi:hypothetical protein
VKISKKRFEKKGPPSCGHWEGKFWCDCRTRGFRKWLGLKLFGKDGKITDFAIGKENL